jgi:hypothetical protein
MLSDIRTDPSVACKIDRHSSQLLRCRDHSAALDFA